MSDQPPQKSIPVYPQMVDVSRPYHRKDWDTLAAFAGSSEAAVAQAATMLRMLQPNNNGKIYGAHGKPVVLSCGRDNGEHFWLLDARTEPLRELQRFKLDAAAFCRPDLVLKLIFDMLDRYRLDNLQAQAVADAIWDYAYSLQNTSQRRTTREERAAGDFLQIVTPLRDAFERGDAAALAEFRTMAKRVAFPVNRITPPQQHEVLGESAKLFQFPPRR